MKKRSKIPLIIIVIILILISILAINILFTDKDTGKSGFSYLKDKLTSQNNRDTNQENTNPETTDNPTAGGISSRGEDSGGGGGGGGGGGSVPTSSKNCEYNQVSYSIGELNEYYFCNLEQGGICVDKTAKCSVEVINFDKTLGGTFGILFTLNEKENRDNIIQTQTSSAYIEADSKQKLMIETTLLGTEANKDLSCSYTSTQVPQHEICS